MGSANFLPAKIAEDGRCIIDSSGRRVEFSDPRIVHAWPLGLEGHRSRLIAEVFRKRGLNFRVSCGAGAKMQKLGKKICTGRECVPFVTVAGNIYSDIATGRRPGEITLYHLIDQVGPCQNGAWPVVFDAYIKRNRIENVIVPVRLRSKDNYLGQGPGFARDSIVAYILSDIVDEAEGALLVAAADREGALDALRDITERLYRSLSGNLADVQKSLEDWALSLAQITLARPVREIPKVLIFGGINVQMAYLPVRNYFLQEGIITKVIDVVESILLQSSEGLVRYSFKKGKMDPKEHFRTLPYATILASAQLKRIFGSRREKTLEEKEGLVAMASWMTIQHIESMVKRLRKIARVSGLLYDEPVPFKRLMELGDRLVRGNIISECTPTIGRYLATGQGKVFDGMVHVGSFNCGPGQITLLAIRSAEAQGQVPFVALDCDGDPVGPHGQRLLENLLLQVKRCHRARQQQT